MWFFGKRRKGREPLSARISQAMYAAVDRMEGERRARYAAFEDSPYARELACVSEQLERSAEVLRDCAGLIAASLPSRDPRREQELEEAWRAAEEELDRILRGLEARLLVAGDAVGRVAEDVQAATNRYLSL